MLPTEVSNSVSHFHLKLQQFKFPSDQSETRLCFFFFGTNEALFRYYVVRFRVIFREKNGPKSI
jgi:hypothetical protein